MDNAEKRTDQGYMVSCVSALTLELFFCELVYTSKLFFGFVFGTDCYRPVEANTD